MCGLPPCTNLACVASLRALVLVPAALPCGVCREARQTGTGEAAHTVGAGRLYATVRRPIEVDIVNVALVNVHTLGLVQTGVTHHAGHTVLIEAAADLPVAADSVQLVAVSVAAVVRGAEAEPSGVVGVLREGEVLRVETEIVATPRPARPVTVLVSVTMSLPLPAGPGWRAPPLTAVVTDVPPTPRLGTVVLPTHADTLTVPVRVTVPLALGTGLVSPAAVFPSPAHPGQSLHGRHLHHHHLLPAVTAVLERILQEGEAGQLALQVLLVVAVGIAGVGARVREVEAAVCAGDAALSLGSQLLTGRE